ncbi:HipA domain-containing protein [Paracoccus ravus]|uniref:HipA domain-containing protein n=1 Tax=Paracoccus ravus TaxID=2447760 RepID=UPI001FD6E2EF|nr:HipA domain-containing protein [Paracoccus ravus]
MNGRRVGTLLREAGGAVSFTYHPDWLGWAHRFPISLSLPLMDKALRGAGVLAVFDNLLPDNLMLRHEIAARMGAAGDDPHSLLAAIGRDCVGALQFLPESDAPEEPYVMESKPLSSPEIGRMLRELGRHPLGMEREQAFRISVAGAQEKTALLWDEGWRLPLGMTATTHILKTRMGHLQSGIDMSTSLENEFICLRLARAFGFEVNNAWIESFDGIDALVVERFDRLMTGGHRLRLPQEDFCQALGVAAVGKYEQDGGPGIADCLGLLSGSLRSLEDRETFLAAQLFFWMIGATDGHAKNFSIFLGPEGFRMTPLYDILSAEPALASGQIRHQQMQLAMAVRGTQRHYRIDQIHPRHFVQTARAAGLGSEIVARAFSRFTTLGILDAVESDLPNNFPEAVSGPILAAARRRLGQIVGRVQ